MTDMFAALSSIENGEGSGRVREQDQVANSFEMNTNAPASIQGDAESTIHPDAKLPLEEKTGPAGLAYLKTYDVRFGSYPCFPSETARCIDEFAIEVQHVSELAHKYEERFRRHGLDPSRMSPNNKHRRRYERMRRKVRKRLSSYFDFCIKAHSVLGYPRPRDESINQLRKWTRKRLPQYYRMLSGLDRDDFRILGPRRSVIEEFVKTLPLSAVGRYLCCCLGRRSPETGGLAFEDYGDKGLSIAVVVIIEVGLFIFVILPMSLMSYHAVSEVVGASVIIGLCFLMCLLTQVLYDGEDVRFLVIFAYGAIMSTFLSPSK